MRVSLSILFASVCWFAVVAQYLLMIDNRTVSVLETTVRFFSYFTILTNTLAALYFTFQARDRQRHAKAFYNRPGILTALTVYITVVCLVYQIILRADFAPVGFQLWVDHLLHLVNPIAVVLYWFLYEQKVQVEWRSILRYLTYPVVYLMYILLRGSFSGFYPYPFVEVNTLGWGPVLRNSALLFVLFIVLWTIYYGLGKVVGRPRKNTLN